MPIKFMFVFLVALCGHANADTYLIQFSSDGVVAHNIEELSFSSNKTSHSLTEEVTFYWSVSGNPEKISISGYGEVTGKSGSVTFTPGSATSITLTAVANGISKTKSVTLTLSAEVISNVCRITFSEMSRYFNTGSALGKISILDGDNNSIPFGALSSNLPTKAIFANATVTSSSTWLNSDYYFVSYAIAGYGALNSPRKYYWLGDGPSTYSIKFNQPQSVRGISLSDIPSNDGNIMRGQFGYYKVTISDCENKTIKTILAQGLSSNIVGAIGFIDITK